MASRNEQMALIVSNNRKQLKNKLMETKALLVPEFKARFQKPTFDFENKRLISDDGQLYLQWKLRRWPDQPESYKNQQTNRGDVVLVEAEVLATC